MLTLPVYQVLPASPPGPRRPFVVQETTQRRRHPVHETVLRRAVKDAVRRTGLAKRAHTLRHSFATHLLEDGLSRPEFAATWRS